MARRISFKADAPRPCLPHHLHLPRFRSKRKDGRRAALRLGFADAKCGVGKEIAACDGEARDLQERVDGRRGGLLHLPAAGL